MGQPAERSRNENLATLLIVAVAVALAMAKALISPITTDEAWNYCFLSDEVGQETRSSDAVLPSGSQDPAKCL